jgi:hypothetical protein
LTNKIGNLSALPIYFSKSEVEIKVRNHAKVVSCLLDWKQLVFAGFQCVRNKSNRCKILQSHSGLL